MARDLGRVHQLEPAQAREPAQSWVRGGRNRRGSAAGMIIGFSDLAKLAVTVERELTRPQPNPVASQEAAIVATA